MNFPLFIARRYLFAKKSHNVINVISAISAIGMAIGTAALVLILSVYNGFDDIIRKNLGDISPDLLLTGPEGIAKFTPDSLLIDDLFEDPRVESVQFTLEDNVFLTYAGEQCIARAKGVEDDFERTSKLSAHLQEGVFQLHQGEVPLAVVGSGVASKLGLHTRFKDALVLSYPDRESGLSISDPTSSTRSARVFPSGIMTISSDTDAKLVILPLHIMQALVGGGDDLVSGVEITLKDNSARAIRRFKRDYASRCVLLDRYEQEPTLFKMMKYEKAAVFLILIFVVLIVALNIYGSLSMLIIEKEDDIETLRAMGASDALVRRIFVLEGWLISLFGLVIGLVAGVALALLQQHFGFVKMPGNFIVTAYPVVVKFTDILLTVTGVALIGLGVALVAARRR